MVSEMSSKFVPQNHKKYSVDDHRLDGKHQKALEGLQLQQLFSPDWGAPSSPGSRNRKDFDKDLVF